MNIISVCFNRSLNCLSCQKATCMQLLAVSHTLLFGVENGRESILYWWFICINLFAFIQPVGWKVRKYILLILFVDVRCFLTYELNNQCSSRKLYILLVVSISKWGMAINGGLSGAHSVGEEKPLSSYICMYINTGGKLVFICVKICSNAFIAHVLTFQKLMSVGFSSCIYQYGLMKSRAFGQ